MANNDDDVNRVVVVVRGVVGVRARDRRAAVMMDVLQSAARGRIW